MQWSALFVAFCESRIDRWPSQKRQLPDILSGLVYLAGFLAFIDFNVALHGSVTPSDGKAMLARAMEMCKSILDEPAPEIVCMRVAGDRVVFAISWCAGEDRIGVRRKAICWVRRLA